MRRDREARRASLCAALLFFLLGCELNSEGIVILEPPARVTDFEFTVQVAVSGLLGTSTLDVRLNDVPLSGRVFFPSGSDLGVLTFHLEPGPPLLDQNLLSVKVTGPDEAPRLALYEFEYRPPKARLRRIEDSADLIRGPLAHGAIGDWLLENDVARFIVQDVAKRDLYSVGAFGGNLIDAELVGRPGLDNFLEIQPMINIETVINAQTVEVVNDGQDGTAAILVTCGPDDLLDFVNPSSVIGTPEVPFPELADDTDLEIEGCTEYALDPGVPYIAMTTTVHNQGSEALPLFVGDWINAAGEVEQWTRPGQGIGASLFGDLDTLSYFGFGEAQGVDYSYATIPVPDLPDRGASFLTASGVTTVLHNHSILLTILGVPPPFVVPAGESRSFTRFFGVGDGSGSNAVEMASMIRGEESGVLEGCITVAGVPAPGARVTLGTTRIGAIDQIISTFVSGEDGCYSGSIPVGDYAAAAAQAGTPYLGGGSEPELTPVVISSALGARLDFDLPATGALRVTVVDESGAPLPARVSVVGFDPSPEPVTPGISFGGLGGDDLGLFNDLGDGLPFGLARVAYTAADGWVEFDIEPSTYQVFVSRGTEYSLFVSEELVEVVPGSTTVVNARIARVLDTAGFVSSDFHVHGINSADSRITHRRRVAQFAGEGVENVIMTDHHVHTDLAPTIAALGLSQFLASTIGEEITTFDYGHFNAYPLTIDPTRPSGGSTDWARAADPGRDFPAYGAFSATPGEILSLAKAGPRSTPDTVVQINHVGSHFEPLQIDTSRVPPISLLDAEGKLALRIDPDAGNLFQHFPALELWNGDSRGAQSSFLNERIGIWFNHLNQGLLTTAIADTDSHTFTNLNTAGARSWTASPTDAPAEIESANVAFSVAQGKSVGGQGIYVQARLVSASGEADLSWGGSPRVASEGDVDLHVYVQAPLWAEYDTIEIYANAATEALEGRPFLFRAIPTVIHHAGSDFVVGTADVFPEVPGARRLETHHVVPFVGLSQDTWFVVVVRGRDDVSRPMFPVFADNLEQTGNVTLGDLLDGNLGERGVLAVGFTNPLFADVDGVPGFHPPWAPAP